MDPTKNLEIVKLLTPDEIKVCQYFKLTDDAIETLIQTTFSKPDEFLHLFVVNNEYLENYLKFLIDNCKVFTLLIIRPCKIMIKLFSIDILSIIQRPMLNFIRQSKREMQQ